MKVNVIWEPQPGPQTALLACPKFEVFFGGARGGGKTDGMLGEWISHQDRYGEHANAIMFRRERTQLVDTIERSRQLFGPLGATFHEQEKLWRFPNGSRFQFAYLDRDSDADGYQGRSHTRVYIEEIGTFPNPSPIFKLMATLRSGHGIPCGFRATGNPGGPGHQWVRARYIDPAPLGWRTINENYTNPWTTEMVRRERIYIPSKLSDNRYLGADYVANLQMVGNQQLVRAWLEGDWSVIEGAFFPEFSEAKHVISAFEIPSGWLRFRSADWGSARPFSIGWWAVVGDDYRISIGIHGSLPRGSMVRYREWYGASAPNTGLKLTAEEVADGIVSRETAEPQGINGERSVTYGVLDPAAFSSDGGPSIAERMARRGIFFRRADNARVSGRGSLGGWDQLRARLVGDGDRPMIYFTSNCRDSIRTLPALQHDRNKPEDVDTESEDHACFAAGTIIDGLGPVEQVGQLTKLDTRVMRLGFDDGSQIVCTPDHLFMTEHGKWIAAENLQSVRLSSTARFKNSKGLGIIVAGVIFSAMVCDYIAWSGNIILALLQRVFTFITSMKILKTMRYPILYSCQNFNTCLYMGDLALLEAMPKQPLQYGTEAQPGDDGTQSISNETLPQWWLRGRKSLARCAGKLSRLALSMSIGPNSVETIAKQKLCVAADYLNDRHDVYCLGSLSGWLSVNGLIASNCDEIRYACMSRPYIKDIQKAAKGRILGVGPHNEVRLEDLWEKPNPQRRARV